MHVVMRSARARGDWSFLHRRNHSKIEKLVYTWARAKGVRIYRFENVGNHLHFLLRSPSKEAFQQFLKTFAGLAARAVTGSRKGRPARGAAALGVSGRFWDATAFSRLVPAAAFRIVDGYLSKNRLEAIGFRGARLRMRADGTPVVVVGEAPAGTEDLSEAWVRGAPNISGLVRS